MRALFVSALFFVLGAAAVAQPNDFTVNAEIAFGWVKRPDGTKVNLKGVKVPIRLTKLAEPFQIGRLPSFIAPKLEQPEGFTAYLNDNGQSSYGYIEGDPSSLDDIGLSGAAGVPWQQMKFGANVLATHRIIVRWRIFDTALQDTPPGQMAFTDEIADFGTYLQFPSAGVWSFDVNVGIVGIVVPDGQCYFAQQFRDDAYTNGEGPFEFAFSNLFSGGGVSVGTSADLFVWDYTPEPNGIYEWQEYDYFGGPPNEANFYSRITASGTANELLPSAFTVVRGNLLSGGLTDLWYDDQNYMMIRRGFTPGLNEAPINLEVQSVAPSTNIISMTFNAQVKGDRAGLVARLDLFNYATGQWVNWDSWTTNGAEQTRTVIVTSNPQNYVQSGTRNVRARVTVNRGPTALGAMFQADFDKLTWTVVRP